MKRLELINFIEKDSVLVYNTTLNFDRILRILSDDIEDIFNDFALTDEIILSSSEFTDEEKNYLIFMIND
jgi:hypothetical protein